MSLAPGLATESTETTEWVSLDSVDSVARPEVVG